MTDKEILQKAIEKAEKNGFKYKSNLMRGLTENTDYSLFKRKNYYGVIFNHDFAKAFFKNQYIKCYCDNGKINKTWQHHLQQLVLCKEHLKYIEKYF